MEYLHNKQMESEDRAGGRGKKSHDSRAASYDQEAEVGYDKQAIPPYLSDENEVYNLLWSHQLNCSNF